MRGNNGVHCVCTLTLTSSMYWSCWLYERLFYFMNCLITVRQPVAKNNSWQNDLHTCKYINVYTMCEQLRVSMFSSCPVFVMQYQYKQICSRIHLKLGFNSVFDNLSWMPKSCIVLFYCVRIQLLLKMKYQPVITY